jgi:hypothetical protein
MPAATLAWKGLETAGLLDQKGTIDVDLPKVQHHGRQS